MKIHMNTVNNNSNNNTTSTPDVQSLAALINRQEADIAYLIVGAATALINFLLILTIAKSKKLHTRCYFLVANVSIAAVLYSMSFFATAVKRIIRVNLHISEVQSIESCNFEMITCYLGQSACAAVPLATAVDRLLATLAPITYKNKGNHTAVFLASLAWSYSIVDSGFTFYGKDLQEIVLNCNLVSTTDILYVIQSSCAITLAALVVLVYVWVLLALRRQINLAKLKSESVAEAKARVQLKVARSLSVDGCIHLITQVASRVGLALLPLFPNLNIWTSGSYMRMTIFIGLMATFFVFMILNSEFRRSFLYLFRWLPCSSSKIFPKTDGNSVFFTVLNRQTKFNEIKPV